EVSVQQMDVQTYFFRRKNINALGQPRSWTDHLLWHHAAHTVDLFAWQAGRIVDAHAMQGPIHPELGIAMDMSIQLRSESGAICTLSLSFNNDGPLGSFFRYICDTGTWIARYDDLVTGHEEPVDVTRVDVSTNGIELQDREFFAAIREGREPNASVAQVLPCSEVRDRLHRPLAEPAGRRPAATPPRRALALRIGELEHQAVEGRRRDQLAGEPAVGPALGGDALEHRVLAFRGGFEIGESRGLDVAVAGGAGTEPAALADDAVDVVDDRATHEAPAIGHFDRDGLAVGLDVSDSSHCRGPGDPEMLTA